MKKNDVQKKMSPADVKSLCDAAAKAWKEAKPRQKVCVFEWRGKKFKSHLSNFKMYVDTYSGKPVAARYHE